MMVITGRWGGIVKTKFITATLLCLFVFIFGTQSVFATDRFIWIDSNDYNTFLLDSKTIKVVRPTYGNPYVDLWFKVEYTEKGIKSETDSRQKFKLPIDGYSNLAYSLKHYYVNYQQGTKLAIVASYDYDINGKILESYVSSNIEWRDIAPESLGEFIGQFAISYAQKNNL